MQILSEISSNYGSVSRAPIYLLPFPPPPTRTHTRALKNPPKIYSSFSLSSCYPTLGALTVGLVTLDLSDPALKGFGPLVGDHLP
jgi:hypothetical protein